MILDTPGLNDPNKELLLNTTERVIPSADLALVVVDPVMLDEITDDLLRKTLIRQGVSKVMILVSYNPDRCRLDSSGRKEVVGTIADQLKKIDLADVPVEMYCYDSSIGDIINDVSELRLAIRTFLNANALPGRLERVAHAVRQWLGAVELETAARIKALSASDAEKSALKEKVEAQIIEFKGQCEKSFQRLQMDLSDLKDDVPARVDLGVGGVLRAFVSKLDSAPRVEDIRRLCDEPEIELLKNNLLLKVGEIQGDVRTDVEKAVDRYAQGLTEVSAKWQRLMLEDFGIERPILAKVPKIAWTILDATVWNLFLPFGWLTALLAALLGKKIGIDSTIFMKPILLSQVKRKIEEARIQVLGQISDRIRGNVDEAFSQIKRGLEDYNKAQVEKMRKSVLVDTDSSDRFELEKTKAALSAAIAALQ